MDFVDWWGNFDGWTFAGTLCLGFTIGWLVWTFVNRATTFQLKALSTVAAIVAGSGLLIFWQKAGDSGLIKEANAYFIGVFVSATVLALLKYNPPPNV